MTDHLAALFASAARGPGRGAYVPGRYDLWLRGAGAPGDRLVHHHEAQHVILSSASAWGAALYVAAEMPGWQTLFGGLLDRCRTTHESFATYLGRDAVQVLTGSPVSVLVAFPDYARLVKRLDWFLEPIDGAQRRALAATALAQVCMQSPILDHMLASWPAPITLGTPLRADLPDERHGHLLRVTGLAATASAAADAAVARAYGSAALDADRAHDNSALDDAFDPAWALWEETTFQHFALELRRAGATVLNGNDGHISAAAALVAHVAHVVPETRLTVNAAPTVGDLSLLGMVLNHTRLWLGETRRPGRFVTVGSDVEPGEVVRVADATSRIGGRPNLVISARLPARLLSSYDYPDVETAVLRDRHGPVVGARSLADDGAGNDAIWFAELPSSADFGALVTSWNGRGDLTCCVAASCLAHPAWRSAWLPALHAAGPLVWLIDVGVSALAGEFGGGRPVHGLYLDLKQASAGARRAVAFKVDGVVGIWVFVGDELGVQLITQQVDELPGVDLRMTGHDWTAALPAVQLVLIDLLRAESYLDLRGWVNETPR
ncbi:hypothetical protein [Micromonospora andamanensis]|uniref:hypothetical protein n=1 Tax=Micromonospora andamanensis TaxID=1287068 RepID=UPI00194EC597|nr:hypothetical protein [Micromonospora andamanensis]